MDQLCGPKRSSEDRCTCHSPGVVALGSIGVFLIGLIVTVWSLAVMRTEGFEEVSLMLEVSTGQVTQDDPTPWMTPQTVFWIVVIAGLLTVVIAVLGFIGVHTDDAKFVCIYYVGAGLLAVFFLVAVISCVQMSTTLGPVADRKADEFCNPTTHEDVASALGGCDMHHAAANGTCGTDCQRNVDALKLAGGCRTLKMLCHTYYYELVGQGYCQIPSKTGNHEPVMPPTWEAVLGYDGCRTVCDSSTWCVGFSYHSGTEACRMVQTESPTTPPGTTWTSVAGAAIEIEVGVAVASSSGVPETESCWSKDTPLAVANFMRTVGRTGLLCAIALLVLILGSLCGCMFQYTLVTRRKGPKGAGSLCSKMLFGGFGQNQKRNDKFASMMEEEEAAE